MKDDNPTKELTAGEKLDRILSRFDKLQERFGGVEEGHAREMRKLDTMLAAIERLQEEYQEIKFELRRLNENSRQ